MGDKDTPLFSFKHSSEAGKETLKVENNSYLRLIPTYCFKVVVMWFMATRN